MFSIELLLQMISLGLVFVLFATGAYKKSITTAIYILSIAIAFQCYSCDHKEVGIIVVVLGAIIALARTMFHHQNDTMVRG